MRLLSGNLSAVHKQTVQALRASRLGPKPRFMASFLSVSPAHLNQFSS